MGIQGTKFCMEVLGSLAGEDTVFVAVYETQKFIAVFTRALNLTLS
jgi:arginine repressor